MLKPGDSEWQILKGKLESILAICIDCDTSVVPRDIVAGNFNFVHFHSVKSFISYHVNVDWKRNSDASKKVINKITNKSNNFVQTQSADG